MRTKAFALAAALSLSGCAGLQGQVEDYGGTAFDALEQSSVTFGRGALRYMCRTIRVEALKQVLPNESQRQGRDQMCEGANW